MRFEAGVALGGAILMLLAGPASAGPAENKVAAYQSMVDLFSKQDPQGVERYFNTTDPYIQHNTRVPDGIDALRKLAQDAKTWNNVHINIYRGLADKDLVVLHSVYKNLVNRTQLRVAFDLFRFDKNGKIIEHWDALDGLVDPDPATGQTQVDGTTGIVDRDKTEANRAAVTAYIEAAFLKPDPKRVDALLSKAVIDHHTGPSQLRTAGGPGKGVRYVKLHRTVAEGNFVFVQGEGRINGEQILEIYDLFRLKDGKIVEHWDVHQALSPPSEWAHKNGPF